MPEDKPIDSVDLIPYLTGKQQGRPHEQLFWCSGRKHAARVGDWKLVVTPPNAPMLFNLKDDIGEQKDLATERPSKLKELQTIYAAWYAQMMPAQWIRQDRRNAEPGGKFKVRITLRKSATRTSQRSADAGLDVKVSEQIDVIFEKQVAENERRIVRISDCYLGLNPYESDI